MPPKNPSQPLDSKSGELARTPQQQSPTSTSQPVKMQPSLQSQQALPSASSIYPEATHGITASTQTVPSQFSNPTKNRDLPHIKSDTTTKLIIAGVIILGLYIAVPAILSLIGYAKVISYGNINVLSNQGGLIYVIDIIYMMIGLGLIWRKELARIAYVILGVFLLIIGAVATINYLSKYHSIPTKSSQYSQAVSSAQAFVDADKTSINNYLHNTQIPPAQRQQVVAEQETNLSNDQRKLQQAEQLQKKNSGILHNTIIQLIPTYLLALLPLIFLTRPRVKQVFN